MIGYLTDAILGAQRENGAFVSWVALNDRRLEDRNGFITALVVRAIGHGQQPPRVHAASVIARNQRFTGATIRTSDGSCG